MAMAETFAAYEAMKRVLVTVDLTVLPPSHRKTLACKESANPSPSSPHPLFLDLWKRSAKQTAMMADHHLAWQQRTKQGTEGHAPVEFAFPN